MSTNGLGGKARPNTGRALAGLRCALAVERIAWSAFDAIDTRDDASEEHAPQSQ
jgi:hypothetical protein